MSLTPLALALLVPALLAGAHASVNNTSGIRSLREIKHNKLSRKLELPPGCLYNGRWHTDGALVRTREACLLCVCASGALSCRRQTCAPLPEPPPHCRVVHRRDKCCPELHCPDGVKKLDHGASARLDDVAAPKSIGHGTVLPACVEGGTVYAAGSAMSSNIACEQCFCLGGARRCVRPRCLPPPDGCQAQPASGACCPQRYYCQHIDITPSHIKNLHDCRTEDGVWIPEGEKVPSVGTGKECVECFCLGGSILCQSLSCAPKLKGCTPLVLPGQCCPHQYLCNDQGSDTIISNLYSKQDNFLVPLNENRSFHTSKSAKRETTIKAVSTHSSKKPTLTTMTNRPTTTVKSETIKKEKHTKADLVVSEPLNNTKKHENITTTHIPEIKEDITTTIPTTVTEESTIADVSTESITTEQPERTIKIIINGTVNCTTELSSSTMLLNASNTNDSVWINSEIHPRVPFINKDPIEAHTSLPNEIITNKVYNEEFDDNESFTINVTSSLRTNTSSPVYTRTTITTTTPRPKTVPPILVDGINASKSKKDELDYDYNEPTLPPSLPNLKIIPFVAADAVVDDEISPKETPSFTSLEQNDKFPVYYPGLETKEDVYPIRREDDYNSNQYPIFVTNKAEKINYPSLTEDSGNANTTNVLLSPGIEKFTVATSHGDKIETKVPEPSVDNSRILLSNLFSPPAETEGGFIPKSPGAIDEFYSIYPSTPSGPVVPHLTTSMQIETKEECISSDGQRVADGVSIDMGCSSCICAWGELHCSPRPCHTPPGCSRRPATIHSLDLCCGELICDYESTTKLTTAADSIKQIVKNTQNLEENIKDHRAKNNSTTLSITENMFNKEFEKELIKYNNSTVRNNTQAEVTTAEPITSTANVGNSVRKTTIISEDSSNNQSLEYEEDDEDEGFSLGSVLKLLLSENYETKTTVTTLSPTKKTNMRIPDQKLRPNTPKIETTTKTNIFVSPDEFVPMPQPIMPFKKLPIPNAITRIDHLLLGESNAIRDNSPQPLSTPRPTSTTRRQTIKTTHQLYTSKPTTKKEIVTEPNEIKPVDISQLLHPSGFGLGLPKLAGCNIYGQMYRVGRIITELSTPCQECRCTEFGVHCTALAC